MVRGVTWVIIALVSGSSFELRAAPPGLKPLDLFPALMDTLMAADYSAARLICQQIEQDFPGHPAATYGKACVIYAHITDFEDTTGRGEFFLLCDSAIGQCKVLKQADNSDIAPLSFLQGSAYTAKALILHREGSTLSALRLLMKGRGEFQEAIEADPQFYDAYLGRGAYRYGAAMNASLISWLPIIPSAESGWKDMWLAVDSSKFSKWSALSALVWFVIQEGDYALADSICDAGLTRFPGCRCFLWPRISIQMKLHQWARAEATIHELLNSFLAHPDNNGYDAIGLYANLVICADSLNRPNDAVGYAKEGLATYRKPDVNERRKEKLRILEERVAQADAILRDDK